MSKIYWLPIGIIIGALACGAFGITMSIRQSSTFADDCEAAGGQIYDAGRNWLCIDRDGRIIPMEKR